MEKHLVHFNGCKVSTVWLYHNLFYHSFMINIELVNDFSRLEKKLQWTFLSLDLYPFPLWKLLFLLHPQLKIVKLSIFCVLIDVAKLLNGLRFLHRPQRDQVRTGHPDSVGEMSLSTWGGMCRTHQSQNRATQEDISYNLFLLRTCWNP